MIFAIQHGIYKLAAPRDEFDDQHHAFLTIIDTKGIESAFMPINKILHDSQLDEKTSATLWSGYYTHEFVAQNYLTHNGHSVSFSFQQLADAGLFRVYDEFQDESKFGELCGRWQELTASIWQETPWTMTASEKSVMERLVKEVEPRHKYMVVVNFLSLKARGLHDQHLYAFLEELHKGNDESEDANPALVQSPEMKGAYRMTNLVRASRGGSSAIALLGSLTAGDFFMTAEEGLSFLVRSSGTPFEISKPLPQEGKSREPEDSGSGAAVASTSLEVPEAKIAEDSPKSGTSSDRDLPSFAGLITRMFDLTLLHDSITDLSQRRRAVEHQPTSVYHIGLTLCLCY